jgi:phage repressor protein C with HTH and peptisase S24 domain
MTHQEIWDAIESFASERKMTCSGLARISCLDPTTFNRSKRWSKYGQPRWPSTCSIAKVLIATESEFQDFAKFLIKKKD